ncbi:MAG TPA: hypothetical protein VNB94_00470 [Mycobacteriales bacterium]|nr:hypothetical protein [Mycobacteriales bacterium]
MNLIHEELARTHQRALLRDAEVQRVALRLALARRWARRAEAAGRRARAAANAVAEIA